MTPDSRCGAELLMTFTFLNNPIENWGMALAVTAGATAAMYFVRALLLRRVSRIAPHTQTGIDDVVACMLAKTYLLFIVAIAVYLGSLFVALPTQRELLVERVAVTALLMQFAVWGDTGLREWRDLYRRDLAALDADGSRRASSTVLGFIARLGLWVVIFLMVLDNLGFNITTLVASLGIGGVAVALAVQNILGDLFASLSIATDKPFEVGDAISVPEFSGTIEHVGLKTTRIRALSGEQIVIANAELLRKVVHNFKRMNTRRVQFTLRINPSTPPELAAKVPPKLSSIIEGKDKVKLDHVSLTVLDQNFIEYDIVYNLSDADFSLFLKTQQQVLLEAMQMCRELGISTAPRARELLVNDATGPKPATPRFGTA
jgi:small-conductance mechanosensitive channel